MDCCDFPQQFGEKLTEMSKDGKASASREFVGHEPGKETHTTEEEEREEGGERLNTSLSTLRIGS